MPAVTRVGDSEVSHCSGMVRASGSGNVYANGISVSRQGDKNTVHTFPAGNTCPPHSTPISSGSSTVFVNSKGCGRIGDPTCTSVSGGSSSVFAGG